MAKMTLLEMTQNILSAMDSDEVNDIADTAESEQVAEVIKETYFLMVDDLQLPSKHTIVNLESAVPAFPTKMRIPDGVSHISSIKYNAWTTGHTDATYRDVIYETPIDFLNRMLVRAESATNIDKYTDNGIVFLLRNDTAPTYWTSFNDKDIIFDSYDSDVETNLQASKTTVLAESGHSWVHSNSAIPDLPENLFSLLLSEAKSTCFFNFKQSVNQKAEQINRRRRVATRKDKWATNGGIKRPNYGRK